jgi:hypothetical protein
VLELWLSLQLISAWSGLTRVLVLEMVNKLAWLRRGDSCEAPCVLSNRILHWLELFILGGLILIAGFHSSKGWVIQFLNVVLLKTGEEGVHIAHHVV